jgi:O-antigen/teichoic acid export membrane protein
MIAIQEIIKRLKSDDPRLRDQAVMSLSSVVSLTVNFVSLLIFSKIFGPAISGVYAIFASVNNLLLLVASLRLDQAIHAPRERRDAYGLGLIAAISGVVFSMFVATFLLIFIVPFREHYGAGVAQMVWLLPFFLVTANVSLLLQTFMIREGLFSRYAAILFTQTIVSVCIKTLLISSSAKTNPLIWADFISQTVCCMLYVANLRKNYQFVIPKMLFSDFKRLFREYSEFPLKGLPAAILQGINTQLPYIMLTPIFGDSSMGHYSRALQFLQLPSQIFSNPVSMDFLRYGGEAFRNNQDCRKEFTNSMKKLLGLASVIFPMMWVGLPSIITLLLGDRWAVAGDLVKFAILYSAFGFVCSPLSSVLVFAKKNSSYLAWIAGTLLVGFLTLKIASRTLQLGQCIQVWSFSYAVMYLLLLYISYKCCRVEK